MLRNRASDRDSELPQPVHGVDLRNPQHHLSPGTTVLMQNCYWDQTIRPIPGSTRLTPTTLQASVRIRGGHRFYPTSGDPKRMIAHGTTISTVDNAGIEQVLTAVASNDRETHFATWSITGKCYASNGLDNLYGYDGATFATLIGTAIPTPLSRVAPVLDRLFAITADGIERTNPRVDTVWSLNSSWATLRPSRPGPFTALHPFSLRGTDTIYSGAFALQANAYYVLSGTEFGADVTLSTPPANLNQSFNLIDPTVGSSSPKGVCTVPGVGIFWVTSDLNVYWVREGQLHGQYIGDVLTSNTSTKGLNNANLGALDQIWLTYFDRKLLLGFPTGASTYPDTQYWLDLRFLTSGDRVEPAWVGPMTTDTWGVVWREDQAGELALMAGEGNPTTGAFLYNAYQREVIGHAVGAATTLPLALYQDRYNGYGGGTTTKYVPSARLTLALQGSGVARAGVADLANPVAIRLPVETFLG